MRSKKIIIHYYIMLIPGLIWILLFNIVPMFGITIAFQDYNAGLGIWGSDFIGLDNFKYMFTLSDSKTIFFNTLIIAILKIFFNLLVPLVFALLLNEVRITLFKRTVQTIVYLPHFLSWVIIAGILMDILGYNGPINQLITAFGGERILFFGRADLFRSIVVSSDVWKEFGFKTIIYIAALAGINPALYEAAAIDGAGKLKQLRHITLPSIMSTVVLLAVLSLGSILNAGFDQIFNLYNPLVYSTGDIIDTWVYRTGLLNLQYGLSTAVGLLKSVIGFIMISVSYWLAYRFANYRIF